MKLFENPTSHLSKISNSKVNLPTNKIVNDDRGCGPSPFSISLTHNESLSEIYGV